MRYDWPGNVRELLNVIERAVSFAESDTIELQDLPEHVALPLGRLSNVAEAKNGDALSLKSSTDGVLPSLDINFKDAKEQWVSSFEREYIEHLLRKNNNNISHAAREAQIDRKYFRKLMRKYDIQADDGHDSDD